MNWLYFSTSDLKDCGSRNSCASSFRNRLMVVPRLSVGPRGSSTMVNSLAFDSQIYCLSSLCLEVTTTVSATVGGREGRRRGKEEREGGEGVREWEGREGGRERGEGGVGGRMGREERNIQRSFGCLWTSKRLPRKEE